MHQTTNNNATNNNNNATRSLCYETEDAQLAHVRGEASARWTIIQLDAVWTKPRGPKYVSTGVQAASGDHVDPAHCGHVKHRGKHVTPTPHGCSDRGPRGFLHRNAVAVEGAGNVPTWLGHRAVVGQCAAPKHLHAEPVATSVQTNTPTKTNTIPTFHAHPVQGIELHLALINCLIALAVLH